MDYESFLQSKLISIKPSGFKINRESLPSMAFEYQKDLIEWALMKGRSALFCMTGRGKSLMELSWADQIVKHKNKKVLGFAPLAVAKQTVREGEKFGIDVHYTRSGNDLKQGINIANYEMIHAFNPSEFEGVFLDESSILKHKDSKTKKAIIEFCKNIPYKLALTATPSPNDFMELGSHSEFLGVMKYDEMLSTFFVHDSGDTSKWRLKGHAKNEFWKWLSEWAVFLNNPSNLGYSDDGFTLPPLYTHEHIVDCEPCDGFLFPMGAVGLSGRNSARRSSIDQRIEKCIEIVENSRKPFMIWANLNEESERIAKELNAVEIAGKHKDEYKEEMMIAFSKGEIPIMVSKPSICGMGLNFQACADTAFIGLSDSFEMTFQATKRFHRYGQTKEVNRHLIYSENEGNVRENLLRKENEFMQLIDNMTKQLKNFTLNDVKGLESQKNEYSNKKFTMPKWAA